MNQCHACKSRHHAAMSDYFRDRAIYEVSIESIKQDLSRLQAEIEKEYDQLNKLVYPNPEQYRCDVHAQEPDFFKRNF